MRITTSSGKVRELARKKTFRFGPEFEQMIAEWKAFLNGIPGRSYAGIEIQEDGDGDLIISAGYAQDHAKNERRFTAEDRNEMEAYAASVAGNVASINSERKAG